MRDVHCVPSPPRRPSAMGRYRLKLRPRMWVVQCHGSMPAEIYRVTLVIKPQRGSACSCWMHLSGVQLLFSPEFYELRCASNIGVSAGSERSLDCAAFSSVIATTHIA